MDKSMLSPWIQNRRGNVSGKNSKNGRSNEKSNKSPLAAIRAVH